MELISQSASEPILNKTNLDRIKKFIIAGGERCVYSNMYNNSPCFKLPGFQLYLNPDPGPDGNRQWNISCDITRGDFNTIVFRRDLFSDQYRYVEFIKENEIKVSVDYPEEGMTQRKLRAFPEAAVLEMLKVIDAH
ncbi:MAG: hypothetical protein V4805_00935 [Pseudomonadota bacterium]